MRLRGWALAGAMILMASRASALTIDLDFSTLGRVYQNGSGVLSSTSGSGLTDVTTGFEKVASYVASTLEKAIGVSWTETISFQLASLTGAVAASGVSAVDGNGRPTSSLIVVDKSSSPFFIDSTPADNSEYVMTSASTPLGGGSVNVSRFGNATAGSGADNDWDLASILLHEMEHSVAINAIARYYAVVPNDPGDMVIPSSLTGLPTSFALPIAGGHVDGRIDNGLFNDNAIATPGFGVGQRALLAATEIYGLCYVEGCTASEVNTDPYATAVSAVPLPASAPMFGAALLALGTVGFGLRRMTRMLSCLVPACGVTGRA